MIVVVGLFESFFVGDDVDVVDDVVVVVTDSILLSFAIDVDRSLELPNEAIASFNALDCDKLEDVVDVDVVDIVVEDCELPSVTNSFLFIEIETLAKQRS